MDYLTADGRNPILEWYADQDSEVQAALDFTMHQLKVTDDWTEPPCKQFSVLERKHAGLSELRFWTGNRKFRVAGLYRPNRRDFIMLVGCEKWLRGIFYKPTGAFDLAMKYKQDFEAGKGHVVEHI
jgi:hypothetical protein